MSFHHIPVLLAECIDGLAIRPDGIYLDGTAGGAGHSKEIAARLTTGRLIALDQDPDAVAAASRLAPDLSMGMAAGLIPIPGRVINEAEACKILGAAEVQIVARGGIQGSEGGCTLLASFDEHSQGEAFFNEILTLSGTAFQKSAGDAKSLKSCLDTACGPTGAEHRGCWYRSRRRELPV